MINIKALHASVIGGGSGPISIENVLLDYIPHSDAITNGFDYGGHTRRIRDALGIAATGDASRRIAVRIRNNREVQEILLYRHPESGDREGTSFIATCHRVAGSFSGGIMLAEEAFKAWYVPGRVFPICDDDNIHLRLHLSDGRSFVGEGELDDFMVTESNNLIANVSYTKKDGDQFSDSDITPQAYEPALDSIRSAGVRIITPGTWWGSILSTTEVPGVYEALKDSDKPIVVITNAIDVKGRSADYFLKYFADKIGRPIDLALINEPNFDLPESYKNEYHFFVEPNEQECKKYAKKVVIKPFATVLQFEGKPTIRHDGELVVGEIITFLVEAQIISSHGLENLSPSL
jgi:uncharacterized cofD-like protein